MIKGLFADILITIYLLGTLFLRIIAEPALEAHPFISIGVGVVLLAFLWSLIKTKVLEPNYFGFFKKK